MSALRVRNGGRFRADFCPFECRICPGRHLALNTLLIFAATVLHAFNITAGVDEKGAPIELTLEVIVGALTYVTAEFGTGL